MISIAFMRYESWNISSLPTGRRELALDHAKTFYELFNLTAKELVTSVVERGAVFRELDYMNALQLLHRSQPHPDPAKYYELLLLPLTWNDHSQADSIYGEIERGFVEAWGCGVEIAVIGSTIGVMVHPWNKEEQTQIIIACHHLLFEHIPKRLWCWR